MAARTLNLKCGGISFVCTKRRAFQEEVTVRRLERVSELGPRRVSELGPRRVSVAYRPLVAAGKRNNQDYPSSSENNDPSNPEGDGPAGINPANDKSQSDESSRKSQFRLHEWRDVRANLVAHGDKLLGSTDPKDKTKLSSKPLGSKWAHPIPVPEVGCVLIATDKLDEDANMKRSVVLLLRAGNKSPTDGPYGVIINCPYEEKVKRMGLASTAPATFPDTSSLFFGGPLKANLFLVKIDDSSPVRGFLPVVPGICYSGKGAPEMAVALMRSGVLRYEDFKFFVGYVGWLWEHLMTEIEQGLWVVASCSSDLIGSVTRDNYSGLWAEILQLMGGKYADLSRKPDPDSGDQ